MQDLGRKAILGAATNRGVRGFMSRYGMRLGASRFVAGETLEACLDTLATLNAKGLYANTTLLGEDVTTRDETLEVVAAYREVLDRIAERELRANVALKLTHLGLLIDEELAFENVGAVVAHAASLGNSVRIDMEQSAVVDATLRSYRQLREERIRQRRLRPTGVPVPDAGRPRRAAPTRAEPAARQGRIPRAGGDRVPAQDGR